MSIQASSSIRSAIACPFCGLACDDLQVDTANSQANVIGNGCPRSVVQFRPPLGNVENRPAVDGRIVSLPEAVAAAARILAHSAQRPGLRMRGNPGIAFFCRRAKTICPTGARCQSRSL